MLSLPQTVAVIAALGLLACVTPDESSSSAPTEPQPQRAQQEAAPADGRPDVGICEPATGENLRALKSSLRIKAAHEAVRIMAASQYSEAVPTDLVSMRCDSLTGPDGSVLDGKRCATFDLHPPLTGTVVACGTVGDPGAETATGNGKYLDGVLTYSAAIEKAHIADAPYLARVTHKEVNGGATAGDPQRGVLRE